MDITTLLGLLGFGALLWMGAATGELSSIFFNPHGLFVVLGGTAVATLINTPAPYILGAVRAFLGLLSRPRYGSPVSIVPVMVSLAEQARTRGLVVLRNVDTGLAGGFLAHAAQIALEHNDPVFVRKVLEDEINHTVDYQNEVVNVVRTMGILGPMFGLIGTLMGIVKVLKELANPEQVGPAMAVAITSAFYGILFANVVCVPVAGKLRIRSWEENRTKSLVLEGIIEIMKGGIPMLVERRLAALIEEAGPERTTAPGEGR